MEEREYKPLGLRADRTSKQGRNKWIRTQQREAFLCGTNGNPCWSELLLGVLVLNAFT